MAVPIDAFNVYDYDNMSAEQINDHLRELEYRKEVLEKMREEKVAGSHAENCEEIKKNLFAYMELVDPELYRSFFGRVENIEKYHWDEAWDYVQENGSNTSHTLVKWKLENGSDISLLLQENEKYNLHFVLSWGIHRVVYKVDNSDDCISSFVHYLNAAVNSGNQTQKQWKDGKIVDVGSDFLRHFRNTNCKGLFGWILLSFMIGEDFFEFIQMMKEDDVLIWSTVEKRDAFLVKLSQMQVFCECCKGIYDWGGWEPEAILEFVWPLFDIRKVDYMRLVYGIYRRANGYMNHYKSSNIKTQRCSLRAIGNMFGFENYYAETEYSSLEEVSDAFNDSAAKRLLSEPADREIAKVNKRKADFRKQCISELIASGAVTVRLVPSSVSEEEPPSKKQKTTSDGDGESV